MRAVNIIWDVDFEEDLESLPKEISITNEMDDEDEISDYISDFTGCCHKGFALVNRQAEETNMPDPKNPGKTITGSRRKWIVDKEPPIFTQDRDYVERWL